MKRVRKCDLEKLISKFYRDMVVFLSEDELSKKVDIDVNSVCIYIEDWTEFDSKADKEAFIQNFANKIKKLTFGNLKVIDIIGEEKPIYCFRINIAINYEVIE